MIRQMQEFDIQEVLPHVRTQEAATIDRLGLDPELLLRKALGPFAFAGILDGRVACLWGITFDGGIAAFPRLWLVTTPLIEDHKLEFARESRRFVRWASQSFGILEGCVDATNETSFRWLRWLGFRPDEELTSGYVRMIHGY